MTEQVFQEVVSRERFDNEHNCITIQELQWMIRKVRRYSAMYTMIVLALDTGMRVNELLRLTINHLNGFSSLNYAISKAKKIKGLNTTFVDTKHRLVKLGEFAGQELKAYCDLTFITVQTAQGLRYVSPYRDEKSGPDGKILTQKLFGWKNTASFDAAWFKLRRMMRDAGFDTDRMESLSTWHVRQKKAPCYVVRFHKLRHMALTRYFYQHNRDIKAAQKWIKHTRGQTTDGYVHCASDLGATEEQLVSWSLQELLGLERCQLSLTTALPPEQTLLDMFGGGA
jgi:integrase